MKRKCKSCPYSLFSKESIDKLDEAVFWLKLKAQQKYQDEVQREEAKPCISKEIQQIVALLKLTHPELRKALAQNNIEQIISEQLRMDIRNILNDPIGDNNDKYIRLLNVLRDCQEFKEMSALDSGKAIEK